jgi:lysophospholipase L1-like esterase
MSLEQPLPAASEQPGRPRLSRWRRLLFIGIVLGTLVIIQEAVFRFMFPLPEALFNRADYMPSFLFNPAVMESRSKALCNVKMRWESEPDGFAFEHTLNLYGFRGPDFTLDPAPGRPRVLFIGDSFVEGCGVDDEHTVPQQFAQLLPDEPPPDVINLGGAAMDFQGYLLLLRDSVPLLRPKVVFLVVSANDLPTNPFLPASFAAVREFPSLSPLMPRALQDMELVCRGIVVPRRYHTGPSPFFAAVPSPANPLTEGTPAPGLDPDFLDAMRRGTLNPFFQAPLPFFERVLRHDLDQEGGVAEYLNRFEAYCRQYGARLVVVYIPFHGAVSTAYLPSLKKLGGDCSAVPASLAGEVYRAQQRHLARVCQASKVAFLDTTEEFIEAEQTQGRQFWLVDGHCTAAGYRLIARICARHWSDPLKTAYR